jgi:hypothetical protein
MSDSNITIASARSEIGVAIAVVMLIIGDLIW